MSALPPYNRVEGERTISLVLPPGPFSSGAPDDLLVLTADGDLGRVEGLVDRLRQATADCVLVAPAGVLEAVLKAMIGARPPGAGVDFVPGARTELAVVRGEVVLRHLNQGAALDGVDSRTP